MLWRTTTRARVGRTIQRCFRSVCCLTTEPCFLITSANMTRIELVRSNILTLHAWLQDGAIRISDVDRMERAVAVAATMNIGHGDGHAPHHLDSALMAGEELFLQQLYHRARLLDLAFCSRVVDVLLRHSRDHETISGPHSARQGGQAGLGHGSLLPASETRRPNLSKVVACQFNGIARAWPVEV